MKNLFNTFLACITLFLLAGCASTGTKVASEGRAGADIKDYDTFNWVSEISEIPNDQIWIGPSGVWIFNNQSTRSTVKDAIESELEARGFTKETRNPDMLVDFSIIEQNAKLRTYVVENTSYLAIGPEEIDVKMVDVDPGTILVDFINPDTGIQIWQGFASRALDESDVEDDKIITSKVTALFDQFDFSGFDHLSHK